MLLSFVADGATDTPALIFHQASAPAVQELRNAIEPLMAGIARQVPLHEVRAIAVDGGVRLSANAGTAVGARQSGPGTFIWEETKPGWFAIFEALEPLATAESGTTVRFKHLGTRGPVTVIMTTGDRW